MVHAVANSNVHPLLKHACTYMYIHNRLIQCNVAYVSVIVCQHVINQNYTNNPSVDHSRNYAKRRICSTYLHFTVIVAIITHCLYIYVGTCMISVISAVLLASIPCAVSSMHDNCQLRSLVLLYMYLAGSTTYSHFYLCLILVVSWISAHGHLNITRYFGPHAWVLSRDINFYRSCYINDLLKCDTWVLIQKWALAQDTVVVACRCICLLEDH